MLLIKKQNNEIIPLAAYEDLCIVHNTDGVDDLSFCIETNHPEYKLLYEEAVIFSDDNEWLIKKIDDDKVNCSLNFDFLKRRLIKNYSSETRTLSQVLEDVLPSGWTVEGASASSIRRSISFDLCTDEEIIDQCSKEYGVRFVWKIKDKRLIVVIPENMQSTGEYITSELNLKKLSFKGETTSFITRLYAYGKDGLTMEDAIVDGEEYGLEYVENTSYCDKTICAYWTDDRYTVADNLYEAALQKLDELSIPIRSYECDVVDLAKINSEYSFLDFSLHKKVTLVDDERGIAVEHQIVKYVEYPENPEKNKITLSCVPPEIKSSMKSAIIKVEEKEEQNKDYLEQRVLMATAMLTGAFGSYFYQNNGELFMMDDPDPAQAEIVWRWNTNGFGKSSTGIDGPYTTALTFDDQFITNIINATFIRGSRIEAESIESEQISQRFKDETVTQALEAANGRIESVIASITNEENTGSLDLIRETLNDVIQTVEGINARFTNSYTGGINLLHNSSGQNGVSDEWTATGVVSAQTNNDTKNSTAANACFVLGANSTLSQTIDNIVSGRPYSIKCKVKKTSNLNAYVKLIYDGDQEAVVFESSDNLEWTEYSITVPLIQSPTVEISIFSRGSDFYVADLIMIEGASPANWTPAPDEIFTSGVSLYKNGIEVYRSNSSGRTVISNTEFAGYYQNEKVFSLNKDETHIRKTIVDGELTVGELKAMPYNNENTGESGVNITLLD